MENAIPAQAIILVVDDEEPLRRLLVSALQATDDYQLLEAGDGLEAQKILSSEPVDVVITDLVMPRMGGEELMRWADEHCLDLSWIILTGRGTMADAVEAVRMGAFDFVMKGADAVNMLLPRVRNAVRERGHARETRRLHNQIEQQNVRLQDQVDKLREACQLLSQQAEMIQEDFRRAAGIQQALLPREAPQVEGVAVNAIYRPCDRVGGDLYDVVRFDDHRLGVCVADAAGHGVAAAMLAVVFKNRLRLTDPDTSAPKQPQEVLEDLNDQLVEECQAPGMFISAAYCLLDTTTGEITIASAGHPPVLVHRGNGRVEQICHSGPALGLDSGAKFAQTRLSLQPGDRVLLYTDGLYQTLDGRANLTVERISEILSKGEAEGIELLRRLLCIATEGQGGRRQDDITLLVLSLAPIASQVDNGGPSEPHSVGVSPAATRFEMAFGRIDNTMVIRLQGQADWTYATAFHQACVSAINESMPLALDLSPCQHLDSTFLGTIHELVTRAELAQVPMRLQGVSTRVRALFAELGMDRVLNDTVAVPFPLPEQMVTLQEVSDPEDSQRRVLQAHEALAALNEQNRRQFEKLIEYLRKEIRKHCEST